MDINIVINSLLNLPEKFNILRNASIYSILRSTGYFEAHDYVSEADIVEALVKNPKVINSWLSWSEDKRASSGWYFKKNDDATFIVGNFSVERVNDLLLFHEAEQACAAYIKREIEQIRNT